MINPSRVAFVIFGREIYWYGVLIAISVILALVLATREAKRKGINPDTILDLALLAIPVSVISGRLYYVLFEFSRYVNDPIRILYIWEGGLAIYGVIIGGILSALIFSKWRKVDFWTIADLAAPGLVLGQAIGRWGNFFNQEAFGPLVTDPGWMWFPFAVKIDATNTIHMATFFYESIWCFAVFLFIMAFRRRFKHKGDVFLWYIGLYAFERMFVEGLRQDSLYLFEGVRVSQLLSFLLFAGVFAFMIVRRLREKNMPELAAQGAALADDGCDCGCEVDCHECGEGCESVISADENGGAQEAAQEADIADETAAEQDLAEAADGEAAGGGGAAEAPAGEEKGE